MRFPFALYRVEGTSMLPTLRPGQRVLVYRWGRPRVGDLIVFKKEARTMVKRVVKVEGEWVEVGADNAKGAGSEEFGRVHRREILGKVALTQKTT